MKHLPLFIFALIAAVGNALFASGQKKAAGVDNSLLFIGFSALICVILTFIFTLFIKEGPTMTQIITKKLCVDSDKWSWSISHICWI